jgi:dTDP-4-dehydrorhamnose reductase
MKVLVYGSTGWIGGKIVDILQSQDFEVIKGTSRLENYKDIEMEIATSDCDRVICAAGLTGRPNVDWCESHQKQVMRINVLATGVLADICWRHDVHLTYFGTGCIYEYDESHPLGSEDCCFKEEDKPNFEGSYYSKTKIITENILKNYENILILRIRMPLSDDLHPRNFITKITKYERVVNIPNSMTVLHEMLPIAVDMCLNGKTGIYNFTNPGTISHNQILDLYKKYIDPFFTYENFTLEDQAEILRAGRSNNCLDVSKLIKEYPNIEPIDKAIVKLFKRMKKTI